MVWSTKSLGRDREYVVLKHKLSDMNGNVAGIKFRGGYAVVEKGSKAYTVLKQLPLLKDSPELPLIHLRKLKFVTRTLDVKLIFGQDVYYHYIKQLNEVVEAEKAVREEQAEVAHVVNYHLCAYKTKSGQCGNEAMLGSPSNFCKIHILNEPGLEDLGFKIPKTMSKAEKKALKDRVIAKLERKPR